MSQAKRDTLALALAQGRTVKDAAAEAGVSERTAYTWKSADDFRKRVEGLRAELFEAAVGKLAANSAGAADALGSLIASRNESIKLGAARIILETGARLREALELRRRLDELERRLAEVQVP
jgi:transposase-like protein